MAWQHVCHILRGKIGSSSNSAMWIGNIAEYSRYYRVYAVDVPGEHGKSEPIRRELKGTAYARWMEDIFALLNIRKATLMGISLGRWMALKLAKVGDLCPHQQPLR